ncbi:MULTISPECIES: phosphotransferase [Halomonadaceae]|uniref:phosphotransferase n=1 Tax=Halomonas sp. BMC7 TaxID=2920520 RepID=UPI0015826BAD|nr:MULTISPECIES: phosphotransferase [Halomonas]MDI4636238.1 phosphotransferase [Halomonas sp. BMC7]NUJ60601.1 phosphotransferase [Halomonas taeanensis]
MPLELPALTEADFTGCALPEGQHLEEYLARHHEIRALWQQHVETLQALPRGLMHGDLSLTNFREWDGKLFLLGLDDACVGPLGGDLAWMLFYAERIACPQKRQRHRERAIRRYTSACREMGASLDEAQVSIAARAVYFKKWLFPGLGTQANLEALAIRQREALAFLEALD